MSKEYTEGTTPSETYLTKLSKHSFLSMWRYPNLYTDKGRKSGKGDGKELCDLLVVFGGEVIVFSVKEISFNKSIKVETAWSRWYRKAVEESVDQILGAENWITRFPDRIYTDKQCLNRFPISFPDAENIKVHRIAIALGVYDACRDFFGGSSLGSLMIDTGIVDDQHLTNPFNIGHVRSKHGFVHVLNDLTMDAVMRELDTISDFLNYLRKKEKYLSNKRQRIISAGEEELLAIYLTKLNENGEHDFFIDGENHPDLIIFDEGYWANIVTHPQYLAKKSEDRVSYFWDELIEKFSSIGMVYNVTGSFTENVLELEQSLRILAAEPRIRRRQLAEALKQLVQKYEDKRLIRVISSNTDPERSYVFLLEPNSESKPYDEYRDFRRALLYACCRVASVRFPNTSYIAGIATEVKSSVGASEDLLVLDVRNLTDEMKMEAEQISEEYKLLRKDKVVWSEGKTDEYPEIRTQEKSSTTTSRINSRKKKKLRKIQKGSRRISRKR